jgi:molecular chaperone HscA
VLIVTYSILHLEKNFPANICCASDRALLNKEEQAAIDQEMVLLQKILNEETSSDVLRKAVDHAAKATDEFAQMRMNASIQKALSGKNVAEI